MPATFLTTKILGSVNTKVTQNSWDEVALYPVRKKLINFKYFLAWVRG